MFSCKKNSENINSQKKFKDILLPRKERFGFISFVTRPFNPKVSMEVNKNRTPQDVKDIAANSAFLNSVIEVESVRSGVCKDKLKQQVVEYLDEMALGENLYSTRLVIYLILKIASLLKLGLFLNEPQILKLRNSKGKHPVLFLPTHRSYVDCIIVGYLSFQYDLQLPATAAGIDVSSMAILGKLLRDSAAFFIRRTLAGAPLYEATLQQYVQALVTSYNAPLQFFLEGTRSRSNKSIVPKYGMLSMCLTPIFTNEVDDVLVVPVHISYDRVVEELPFVYEHLGVPKPKESTANLLKALFGANDHFGNVYVNVGTPFSANDFIGEEFKTENPLGTTETSTTLSHNQQLATKRFRQVQKIGDYVVTLHQQYTVTNVSNLLAVALMGSLLKNKPLSLEEVIEEVKWLIEVIKSLGAFMILEDVVTEVERILVVHSKMMTIDNDRKLRLLANFMINASEEVKRKMRGHTLKDETIVNALPVMQLQLYVNPVLHYLVPPALVHALVSRGTATKDQLVADWHRIRKMLKYEFFYDDRDENETFKKALEYCEKNNVIDKINGLYSIGAEDRLQFLFQWTTWPALTTLLKCADVTMKLCKCGHKRALKVIQEQMELCECHPYCLSLDAAANCLQGLVLTGALLRHKGAETVYELVPEVMVECRNIVSGLLPNINVKFGRNNTVILDQEVLYNFL